MAKPILVANWKNHPKSLAEAKFLLKRLAKDKNLYKKLNLFIAPPCPYLDLVSGVRSFANLASQDMSGAYQGTHTGMVTPDILKSFGVKLSIIGHSECRKAGETNESVSKKIKIAMQAGILPLVCVGEVERDQDGEHFEFLRQQLKLSLAGMKKSDAERIMIAYEPSWAIGKHAKDAMKSEDLSESLIFVKKVLVEIFGRKAAEDVPILYGGSVESGNVFDLWQNTEIRGFLVGHDSLNAKDFKIVAESLLTK